MKYSGGDAETLFTARTGTIQYPICLSNGVVVVNVDGIISKIGLHGEVVFKAKVKHFGGASGFSGRLTGNRIFLTETTYNSNKQELVYHLYVVDVAGTEPVVIQKFDIIQPLRIVPLDNEIVVLGRKDVLRLKVTSE